MAHNVQNATLSVILSILSRIDFDPFDQLLVVMYYQKVYQGFLATGPEVSYNSSDSRLNWSTSTCDGRSF